MEWVSTFKDRFNEMIGDTPYRVVAEKIGCSKATVGAYAIGSREPKRPVLLTIARAYGVDPLWLTGGDTPKYASTIPDGCLPLPGTYKVPLLGNIACGEPILAEENLEGIVDVPDFVHATFALRCKDDSMIGAGINDGDVVYIRRQPDIEDGEIAAVLIEDEATLKRVYKIPGRIQLRPENPSYEVMEYTGEELEDIRILGKAVGFTHMF